RGAADDQRLPTIGEFLASEEIKRAPFLQISCAMLASMAVEASMQQAPKPDQGMWTDISTVSTLLPYSDAIFIDNRCDHLLQEAMNGAGLAYDAAVFSMRSRDDLLAWLEELEASASPDHVALVKDVYGKSWLEPYSSMFETPT